MVSVRIIFNFVSKSTTRDPSILSSSSSLVRAFSSIGDGIGTSRRAMGGEEEAMDGSASDHFTVPNPERESAFGDDDDDNYHPKEEVSSRYQFHKDPPNPNPNKPNNLSDLFVGRKSSLLKDYDDQRRVNDKERGNGVLPRSSTDQIPENLKHVDDEGNEIPEEKAGSQIPEENFIEKLKLGAQKLEKPLRNPQDMLDPDPEPQDADEIFKKMKETGLIPNAVSMLDGLCKDGLVKEAMELFKLMRAKASFPEVVIYTAAVEGFCIAQKLDDAKRIFRKMQNNKISPNAYSYTVLIQGLYKGKRLEGAVDFCVEMLEAGHSPNVETFVGLVNRFCREKGVEEAKSIIERLRQKGYIVDERAIGNYLDEKGPFLPLIREAIFGKESSRMSFEVLA